MTNENIIEVKIQYKNWFLKGFLYLFLMLVSLSIVFLPMLIEFAKLYSMPFYVIGLLLFAIFSTLYIFNIYKTCNPSNALVLSARGFVDNINVGSGIEIEWTNVSAVRMLGKANMPFLGVTLENPDVVLAKMKKSAAAEMKENIDQNLPTILIPQNRVRIKIKDLKDTFAKFAREARVLEKDSQQKPKNNPFSTEDVLRAFGKLPKEDVEEPENESINAENDETDNLELSNDLKIESDSSIVESNFEENDEDITIASSLNSDEDFDDEVTVNCQDITATADVEEEEQLPIFDVPGVPESKVDSYAPFEVPQDISKNETNGEPKRSASDSFYESLRAKALPKKETPCDSNSSNQNNNQPDEMPSEIQELLSRAKSSKISEIEKILSDTDIPFSLSRTNISDDNDVTINMKGSNLVIETNDSDDFNPEDIDIELKDINIDNEPKNDDDIAPSLNNIVFDNNENNDQDIKFDLSFVATDNSSSVNNNVDDSNDVVSSLSSLLNDTFKHEEIHSGQNNKNDFGDTKEFIIK